MRARNLLTADRSLAHQLLLELPFSNTLLPIALPTIYLWIVDTFALRRGTWVIESGTKYGVHLWDGLEIEEAVFFVVTNILIVFGLVAFDNALAILQTFPSVFPSVPSLPTPVLLVRSLLTPTSAYDDDRIAGLQQALARLRAKSRSFYLASGVFQGRLRIDMILLYSFCRVADDLVDNAASISEAHHWIRQLTQFLDIAYGAESSEKTVTKDTFIRNTFPSDAHAALLLLPISYLSPTPLYDLVKGFGTDLHFSSSDNPFPIKDEPTLEVYGSRVAGTVAESCIELVYYHTTVVTPKNMRQDIVHAGAQMGIALQYVNIARDITVDALNNRVYLPTSWLKDEDINPGDILKDHTSSQAEVLRQRLLDSAFAIYSEAKGAIEQLPLEARGPMRVAVESYVEIGRVLRKPGYKVKAGRATVPKLRRLQVAWKALNQ
jgi:15-cis-phytoene synthase/lycopene beta-cyclase